ncbi:MAG TPA: IPT/TIG domain-containing protein, partial [Candidatus Acidoferrum sp.]
ILGDVNSAALLCGLGNHGLNFLDASQPGTLPQPAPSFASAPAAQPSEGPAQGGTTVTLAGANFASSPQLRFGTQNPVSASVVSAAELQAIAPASATSGPVNVTAYFSNGWVALAPLAFSFGPSVAEVLPNGGSKSGGDTVRIFGYGFGTSPGNVSVTIGGHAATIQSIQAFPAFGSSLSLDSSYPFSLECITLTTPAGTPGKADITISGPTGSMTAPLSFQFLAASQTFPHAGLYKFVAYDATRQQAYLSATDHVDVFQTKTAAFGSPLTLPPNGPPPSAALRGLALTPDASQLVVADFGAQSVYLINPDGATNNGTRIFVGGVAGFLNSGPARVAATSAQTIFVGLTGNGGTASSCNGCLGQMNLTASPPSYAPAPQPEVSALTGAPLLQSDAAGDAVYLAFGTVPGGPVARWNAAAPNSFAVSSANDSSSDLTTSSDGSTFAVRSNNTTELRGSNLSLLGRPAMPDLETIPGRVAVPGVALHPSGALVYEPFLDGLPPSAPPAVNLHGGVDIRDAHDGRLRLRVYLPEPFTMLSTDLDGLHGGFLTVDENGQRLFALTSSGLTVVQLASVPLGVGSLAPSAGPASGGQSITIRGSGFQSSTTATLGGKSAAVTFKDMNTLLVTVPSLSAGAQRLVLTNADGESTSLDAAFLAQ